MSKYAPERLRGLLPMPRLGDGECTEALRVRGPADVLAWALTLSPAERGAIFAEAHAAQHVARMGHTAPTPEPAPLLLTVDTPAPEAERVERLSLATKLSPKRVRGLSDAARNLLGALKGGGTLTPPTGRRTSWTVTRTDSSRFTVRADIVSRLHADGMLVSEHAGLPSRAD